MSKKLHQQKLLAVVDVNPNDLACYKNANLENLMKFITWNVDGLSQDYVELRIQAVCQKIKEEDADVVFLQEVVPISAMYLIKELENYTLKTAVDTKAYFVGTLLKKSTMKLESDEIIPFPDSEMGRNILKINAKFRDIPLSLLNTHLESTGPSWKERTNQLCAGFKILKSEPETRTVIFAGDMNLRDREIQRIRGLPLGIQDVWTACGSNPAYSYTWDMSRNTNLSFEGERQPRLRFDRVYFSPSYPIQLKPAHFCLIGQEKLPCDQFPSDHWGILCHFAVQGNQPKEGKRSAASKETEDDGVEALRLFLSSFPNSRKRTT